ncbi:MAG TPA: hypothetical protein VJJ23_02915 [Candidatus Nanoarchaeia archaeon]|nr:hypothetical protein [Candidatus Nanoarchaeia archaeon]
MKKRLILLLFVLFLLPLTVKALDVNVQATPIRSTVAPFQDALYNLKITNNENKAITFTITYLDIYWTVNPSEIKVESKSSKDIELRLIPYNADENKPSAVKIVISSIDKTFRTENVLEIKSLKYNELLKYELLLPEPIDPRKDATIRLKLINENSYELNDMELSLESELFNEKRKISIAPFETKTETFIIKFSELYQDGNYDVRTFLRWNDKTIIDETSQVAVGQYPNIKEVKSPESSFLNTKIEVIKTNEGNTISQEIYEKSFGTIQKQFTKFNPEPNSIVKQDGGYLARWEFDLKPGETKSIFIESDYRTAFWIIILALIVIILVGLWMWSHVVLKKRLVSILTEKDGSSMMKIEIVLKNRSRKTLINLKLMDRVGHLSEVPDSFGSMHPAKITKSTSGILMIWNIDMLKPGEERIFSYRAKSKLHVVGKFNIPRAMLRYTDGRRFRVIYSNIANVFN